MAATTYPYTTGDIIKGGHLMVFVDDKPIAFATSHSLQKTLNTTSVTCKDAGDSELVLPQNKSYQIQTDNLYSLDGYQTLNSVFENMATCKVSFGESTYSQNTGAHGTLVNQTNIIGVNPAANNWEEAGFQEYGNALITSLNVTAGAGDNATFTATFQVQGGLSYTYISA